MSSNGSRRASGTGDGAFRVDGIDHVELVVPDPGAAARWYGEVLGLEPLAAYESWADGDGPLVVSSDGGETMLALFGGDPDASGEITGFHRVAFGTDAAGFLTFVDRLGGRDDVDVDGRAAVVDHDLSFSVYFADPWGYPFEVTTYDYDAVAAELA